MFLITILGPTAIGKTKIAVQLAAQLNGEIISADSRQVYRGLNIGSGKDLAEYSFNGKVIPYHLIDILEAGEQYDLFQFQQDFYTAYNGILERGHQAILCGGSGLYLEAALARKQLLEVPENSSLRNALKSHTQQQLNAYLNELKPHLHNTTDLTDRKRTIRAIELATAEKMQQSPSSPVAYGPIFGLKMDREQLYARIEIRLEQRLNEGLIEEVEGLLQKGLSHEDLQYYGLEYKYLSMHLKEELNRTQLIQQLGQAIRKFAKRQMTWFRRMEKRGTKITWINANQSSSATANEIVGQLKYTKPDGQL